MEFENDTARLVFVLRPEGPKTRLILCLAFISQPPSTKRKRYGL